MSRHNVDRTITKIIHHTIGICAIYQNGMSEMAEYEVAGTTTGIGDATRQSDATRLNHKEQIINNKVYDLQGRQIVNSQLHKGVYIKNGRKGLVK